VKVSDNKNFTENPGIYLFVHLYVGKCAGMFRFWYIEIIQLRGADLALFYTAQISDWKA